MYLIVAGCNAVGIALAEKLSKDGHDIAIVDRNQNCFDKLGSGSNYLTVAGIPIDEDVLKEAGIEKADGVYAVTDDDNTNVMIAEVASKIYHVQRTIVRIDDPIKQEVMKSLCMQVICPVTLCVDAMYEAAKWSEL
ncbi:MAG: TrkA family potassium uptake protein [Erysipelotrichaceae bacterium]|jgi:trk system potassium uptake protein TrkA|nr:TrkA family potassium uptake protein [Erysipelotrichaceae bacterium]